MDRICGRMAALPFVVTALVTTLVGCGSADTDFNVKYASGLNRQGANVSLFGVYKDGRMSVEAWNDLAPQLARVFGNNCPVLYGETFVAEDARLAAAIDDQTRAEGITDDLAGLFAPAAAGSLIGFVTVAGAPASAPRSSPSPGTSNAGPMPGSRGPARYGGRPSSATYQGAPGSDGSRREAYELSLSLYSVEEHHSVGLVAMRYTGRDAKVAMEGFVEKLRSELPQLQCRPWQQGVHVDAERVRGLSTGAPSPSLAPTPSAAPTSAPPAPSGAGGS